jgi:hypothetical protein
VADVIAMFTVLSNPDNPVFIGNRPPDYAQIALQTTRNGLLVNVISITPATPFPPNPALPTDSTILLVTYYPAGMAKKNIPVNALMFAAIPIEQVVSLVFSNTSIPQNGVFGSHAFQGNLPIFSVDMTQRAKDIQNSLAFFNSIPNASSSAYIGLQTTLSGPFYSSNTPFTNVINGMIPYIVSIQLTQAPNGTLMLITYYNKPPLKNHTNITNLNYIVVSPDQVYGIVYFPGNG